MANRRKDEERRAQILDAVIQCMAEDGMQGASMSRIAKRARISKRALFYYYPNKLDMLADVFCRFGIGLEQQVDSIAGADPTPQRIDALFELKLLNKDPNQLPTQFWLDAWALGARNPELRPAGAARFAHARQRNVPAVLAGVEKGCFADDIDPVLVADVLSALLAGEAIQCAVDPENFPPERAMQAARLVLALFRGQAHPRENEAAAEGGESPI